MKLDWKKAGDALVATTDKHTVVIRGAHMNVLNSELRTVAHTTAKDPELLKKHAGELLDKITTPVEKKIAAPQRGLRERVEERKAAAPTKPGK